MNEGLKSIQMNSIFISNFSLVGVLSGEIIRNWVGLEFH